MNCNFKIELKFWIVNLLSICSGCAVGWPSPVLPKLMGKLGPDENPLDISITLGEKGWLVSLIMMGCMAGSLFAGFLSPKIGKKKVLLITGIPFIVGNIILAFGDKVQYLCVGRFITGMGVGGSMTVLPLYVGEVADKKNRGRYSSYFSIFIKIGTVISYSIGPFCTVKIFSLILCIPACIFILLFSILFPETPYTLVSTGKFEKAEKSLKKFRRVNDGTIETEMKDISDYLNTTMQPKTSWRDLYNKKSVRRSFIVALGITTVHHFTGILILLSYMETIFREVGADINPRIASIIVASTQIVVTILNSILVDRVGRRVLLLISAAGISIFFMLLGVYFYLKVLGHDSSSYSWVPLLCLMGIFVSYCTGIGPIGFAIIGEIFETHVKFLASTIIVLFGHSQTFMTSYLFPIISEELGMQWAFWILSTACCFGFFFILLFVPETKNKNFSEIKENFNKKLLQI